MEGHICSQLPPLHPNKGPISVTKALPSPEQYEVVITFHSTPGPIQPIWRRRMSRLRLLQISLQDAGQKADNMGFCHYIDIHQIRLKRKALQDSNDTSSIHLKDRWLVYDAGVFGVPGREHRHIPDLFIKYVVLLPIFNDSEVSNGYPNLATGIQAIYHAASNGAFPLMHIYCIEIDMIPPIDSLPKSTADVAKIHAMGRKAALLCAIKSLANYLRLMHLAPLESPPTPPPHPADLATKFIDLAMGIYKIASRTPSRHVELLGAVDELEAAVSEDNFWEPWNAFMRVNMTNKWKGRVDWTFWDSWVQRHCTRQPQSTPITYGD